MRLNKVSVRIIVPKFERPANYVLPPCYHTTWMFTQASGIPCQLTLPRVNKMPLFNPLSLPCVAGSPSFLTLPTLSSDLEEHWFRSSFYDSLLAFSHAFVISGILFGFMSAAAELKLLYSIQTAQERIAK